MPVTIEGEEIANALLLSLPEASLKALLPHLSRVELERGTVLCRPGEIVHQHHFVNRGLISQVKTMHDGRMIEINTRGIKGMTAPEAVFGIEHAILECVVQGSGSAFTISTPTLCKAVARDPALADMARRYIVLSTHQIAQTAACNRLHSLEERACRWLLIAHDSARADQFSLTHEFLAMMLGALRPQVSITAALLRRAGLIRYTRGLVTILDRAGLEEAACECYAEMENEFAHLFSPTR